MVVVLEVLDVKELDVEVELVLVVLLLDVSSRCIVVDELSKLS